MLEQVMRHVRNYFIKDHYIGEFSISGGMLSPHDFLIEGQRFYITGSFLSDGVYTYHSDGIKNDNDDEAVSLPDEDFSGVVYALAVPPTFIALVKEIEEWVGKFGDTATSPFQSETFNGYSYSKIYTGVNSEVNSSTWQGVFRSRLNQWRKVSML